MRRSERKGVQGRVRKNVIAHSILKEGPVRREGWKDAGIWGNDSACFFGVFGFEMFVVGDGAGTMRMWRLGIHVEGKGKS